MARRRKSFFNKATLLERLYAAETAALEQVGTDIVQRARAKAPVRKIYKEKQRKTSSRASPALIAAAIRAVHNNRRLSNKQRTEALYLLQRHPEYARVATRRKGSINTNRTKRLIDVLRMPSQLQLTPQARYDIKTKRGLSSITGEVTRKTSLADVQVGGRLKNSILKSSVTRADGRTSITVSATAPYALYVEFPTRHNRAQPFLLPALHEARQLFPSLLADELRSRGLKRG